MILGVATSWGENKGIKEMIELAKAKPEYKIVIVGRLMNLWVSGFPPYIRIGHGMRKKREECIGFGTRQGFVSGAERDGWLFRIQKLYRVQKGADSCITARIHPFMPSFENTAS